MLPHQGLNKIIWQCYSVWFGFLLVAQNSAQQVKETVLYCDKLQKFNVSGMVQMGSGENFEHVLEEYPLNVLIKNLRIYNY